MLLTPVAQGSTHSSTSISDCVWDPRLGSIRASCRNCKWRPMHTGAPGCPVIPTQILPRLLGSGCGSLPELGHHLLICSKPFWSQECRAKKVRVRDPSQRPVAMTLHRGPGHNLKRGPRLNQPRASLMPWPLDPALQPTARSPECPARLQPSNNRWSPAPRLWLFPGGMQRLFQDLGVQHFKEG